MLNIVFLENHIWLSHVTQVFLCCIFIYDLFLTVSDKRRYSIIPLTVGIVLWLFQLLPSWILILHIFCGVFPSIYLGNKLDRHQSDKTHFLDTILSVITRLWSNSLSCIFAFIYLPEYFYLFVVLFAFSLFIDIPIYFRSFTFMNNSNQYFEFLNFKWLHKPIRPYNIEFLILLILPQAWIYFYILIFFANTIERFNFSHPRFFLASSRAIKDNWHSIRAAYVLGFIFFISCIVTGFDPMIYHFVACGYFFLSAFAVKSTSLFKNRTENYIGMTYFFGSGSWIHNYWNSAFLSAQIQKTARPPKKMFVDNVFRKIGAAFNKGASIILSALFTGSSLKFSYGYVGLNESFLNKDASSYRDVVNDKFVTGFKKTDVISQDQLIAKSQHSVILIDADSELYCYRIYHEVAGRVDCVIDLFNQSESFIADGESTFVEPLAYLLEYKCTISDESIINVSPILYGINVDNDQLFKELDMFAVNINMNLSEYIGLPLNKDWSENQDYYPKMQKELQNNGFFEMNTLLRQMREGGSIPTRFMDAIGIAEACARFLLGLLMVEQASVDDNSTIEYRNKNLSSVSFGKCMNMLRTGIKQNTPLATEIRTVLNTEYKDKDNIARLDKFMRKLGLKNLIGNSKNNHTVLEILNRITSIRNKTRGHGTPSKVDWEFYVALDLLSVFFVHSLLPISAKIYSKAAFLNEPIYLNYNYGGVLVADTEVIDAAQWKLTFDYTQRSIFKDVKNEFAKRDENLLLSLETENGIVHMDMSIYFKQKEGKIFFWNGLTDKREEQWISFTTGGIIRPGYLDELK